MTETQLLQLDEPEYEPLNIGLLSLIEPIPDYEFFFHLNRLNTFQMERKDDLVYKGSYFTYHFSVFKGYCKEKKTEYTFISNQSIRAVVEKPIEELFFEETNIKYLLSFVPKVQYIIKTSDLYPDFSLLLMPENLVSSITKEAIDGSHDLYNLLHYYE